MVGRALLCALVLGLSYPAKSTKVRQQYEYHSVPVAVSQFYDNVATADFDGSGASYPIEHLPTGQLLSENVEVSWIFFRKLIDFD